MWLWSIILFASAKKPKDTMPDTTGLASLETLLAQAHWQPTPEMSGVFEAGRVFLVKPDGSTVLLTRSCFSGEPIRNSYTAVEVMSNLQAGVSVRLGPLTKMKAEGSLMKQVKFGAPSHNTMDRLSLIPTDECVASLARLPPSIVDTAYVIQESLSAEITEQTCGKIDASGRFVAFGEADAMLARACRIQSLEPVVVGMRTVPLRELLPAPVRTVESAPQAVAPKAVAPQAVAPKAVAPQALAPVAVVPQVVEIGPQEAIALPAAVVGNASLGDEERPKCSRILAFTGYTVAVAGVGVGTYAAAIDTEGKLPSAIKSGAFLYGTLLGGLGLGSFGEYRYKVCQSKTDQGK